MDISDFFYFKEDNDNGEPNTFEDETCYEVIET